MNQDIKPEITLFRRPSKLEQYEAKIDTSDYQISGLTIQSSILTTLGMCSHTYRSKCTTVRKSNVAAVKRYASILNKFYSYFPDDAKVKDIDGILQFSTNNINGVFDFDVIGVIRNFSNWRELFRGDSLKTAVTVQFLKANGFDNAYELTNADIEKIEDVTGKLYQYLSGVVQDSNITLKRFISRASVIDSYIAAMFFTDFFKPFVENPPKPTEYINVYHKKAAAFMKKNAAGTERAYSWTVMEGECVQKQKLIYQWCVDNGLSGGLTVQNVIRYWKANEPNVIQDCKAFYGLDLSRFSKAVNAFDWESFALYFYEPSMMSKIRESLNVKVRARAKNSIRKGAMNSYNVFNADKRVENLKKGVGSYDPEEYEGYLKTLAEKVVRWDEENKKAKAARVAARKKYEVAKRSFKYTEEELEVIHAEWEQIQASADQVSKNLSAAKRALKKAKDEQVKKESAIEKIRQYEKKNKALLEEVKSRANGIDATYVSNEIQQRKLEEEQIPYYTWSFKIRTMDEGVVRFLTEQLEEGFCGKGNNDDTKNYVNVFPYSFLDEDRKGVTVISIDYPQSSKLYKLFKKRPEFTKEILKVLCADTLNKTGVRVEVDYDASVINERFEKTLGGDMMSFLSR